MQRGIKQASDAYARVAASIGSLERIVELHDRGVFRDAAHTLGVEEVPVSRCLIRNNTNLPHCSLNNQTHP